MAVSYAISQGIAHKTLTVSKSFLAGLFMTLIAMSLTTNTTSYAFSVLLIIFAVGRRKYRPSRLRKLLLLVTIIMVIWGTFLGFLNGHNPGYILRFAGPFILFALFLMCRNLCNDVYCHRKSLGLVALTFSLFAFLLTKLGLNDLSLLILRGWTLTFSNLSAVAIWHYFALAISASLIFDALLVKKSAKNTLYMWVGLATIVLLVLTTNTNAFVLAIAAAFLPILLARVQPRLIERIVLIVGVAVVLDYMFFEVFTNSLIQGLWDSTASDEGNVIRLIQIEYFRSNFLVLGNGFGPELDFRFFGLGNREISHEAFPYASELPILNVIHGAGVFAAVWFILVLRLLLALMADAGRLSGPAQGKAYFAYAMCLVLYGSISNPFLFSPVSMLMIVIALDMFEEYRQPLRTQRVGS